MSTLTNPAAKATDLDAALLDEPTVGRMLACCGKTVSRRRVPGRVKVGHLTRYVRAEVERWVAAGCPAQSVNTA